MKNSKIPHLSQHAVDILRLLGLAYNVDLLTSTIEYDQSIYLKLERKSYIPLVIEKHEPHIFSLSHVYVQNGDVMFDPDVVFFVEPDTQLVYPTSITNHTIGLYKETLVLDSARNTIIKANPGSADLVIFANSWLNNIRAQNWFLEQGEPNLETKVVT